MNDTSTDTSTQPGNNLNGGQIVGVVADLFKTGINAYYGAQTAQAYYANNPSDQFNNGYIQGQAAGQDSGIIPGVSTQTLLLIGLGVAVIYLARR